MKNDVLSALGISQLSEMQLSVSKIWKEQEDKDIVLLSPTGSGKTIAYLLPLMERIDTGKDSVQAVVIVPSRELAMQTDEVVKNMKAGVRSICCYGGRPAMDEHRRMNAVLPHIIIATPGRLVDHLNKRNFEVSDVRTLVIDEFDKSLEFGFQEEMQDAISMLPLVKKKVLLSATNAEQIPQFVDLNETVRIDYLKAEERVSFCIVHSPQKDKLNTLLDLLRALGDAKSIIFLNYRDAVGRVYDFLKAQGVACEMFHGGMEQDRRERAIYKFSNGTSHVLVSTDLGSRGLDIPDTDCIIHYHLPLNEEAYTHRNGRTARWEAEGRAFMILNEEETLPEYIDEHTVQEFYIPKKLPPISQPKMATIYIGKGKKDKLSKMDVLGFLCKIGGLERNDVGRIDVRDHCSYAAVSRTVIKDVLNRVEGQKIKGIKTIFREAR
ncbi:MAG: DEAD/DEAH box helicase [Bacteroidaceae bacterium]|nr:DEAD/DEAH box helicase [Bacteroidaceae bacterium]